MADYDTPCAEALAVRLGLALLVAVIPMQQLN